MNTQLLWATLDRVTTGAVLVAALVVVWSSRQLASPAPPKTQSLPLPEKMSGAISAAEWSHRSAKGRESARVALLEFSDYQCPFCGRSARELQPLLDRDFVQTGKVKYIFINFPLDGIHREAFGAAMAAECAEHQGKFWEMHDTLFSNQASLQRNSLLAHASGLGLDPERFVTCLKGETKERVDDDLALGRRFNVNSTPVFMLGSIKPDGSINLTLRLAGAVPYPALKSTLEKM